MSIPGVGSLRQFATLLVTVAGMAPAIAQQGQYVEGPEAAELVPALRGCLVVSRDAEIRAVELPSLKSHVVRRFPRDDQGLGAIVHAISGPDDQGRLAYMEDWFFVAEQDRRHVLKIVQLDGSRDEVIFERQGSALGATSAAGNGEVGGSISLAPRGGLLTLLTETKPRQMPGAQLTVGKIELWDINQKQRREIDVLALDEPVSWFPDGRRFLYTRLMPRNELPASAKGLRHFGSYFGQAWDEIPVLACYDTTTRRSDFFHVGSRSLLSADERTALVGGWGNDGFAWIRIDLRTGASSPCSLPDPQGSVVALTENGSCLYVGLPTRGLEHGFVATYRQLGGPLAPWSIKVTDPSGHRFQTLLRAFDPGSHLSYGVVRGRR